jgi:uncharacterized membrane protein YoaK (UPF0700 family)
MKMAAPRLVFRLLALGESCGVREELVGDVMEEFARGRPRLWVWQQLLAIGGLAIAACLRDRIRISPPAIAFMLAAMLLAGVSLASVSFVLEAWLAVYYLTGTLSLFAHMASANWQITGKRAGIDGSADA